MTERFIKDEDGFSLLEVVISIAMLAFLSVFILQMFMTGAAANSRARDIDVASYVATGVIEGLKASDSANDFLNMDFVADTQVAFGLSDYFVIEDKLGNNSFDFSKGVSLYKYYDKNWEVVELSKVSDEPDNPQYKNTAFMLKLEIFPSEDYEYSGGKLFNVNMEISSWKADSGARRLVNYDTKVYFANVGEIHGY